MLARFVGALRIGRWAALDRTVDEAKSCVAERALDALFDQSATRQRAAAVSAAVCERIDRTVASNDDELKIVCAGLQRLPVGQSAGVKNPGPSGRCIVECRVVDPHALGERQMTAEPIADEQQAKPGAGETNAGGAAAAPPLHQRSDMQRKRGAVGGAVHEADASGVAAGAGALGPVVQAGYDRRHGGRGSETDQQFG